MKCFVSLLRFLTVIITCCATTVYTAAAAAATGASESSPVGLGGRGFDRPDFVYHDEFWLADYLQNVSTTFSHITKLYSIGKSVQGRELWVLAIGHDADQHVLLRPEVKLIANIHGDEVVGREMLIHLIDYLVINSETDRSVGNLLRNVRIHILVSMNPDGFAVAYRLSRGLCIDIIGRTNARDQDLNRNFPDFFSGDSGQETQPEALAVIKWMQQTQFVLSASLHGGALVANYPYDNCSPEPDGNCRSPDDADIFKHLAKVYSFTHPTMHRGERCPYDDVSFPDGIVSGWSWYTVSGGMQDYNYIYAGCLELTLEISCCKFPEAESDLQHFWSQNRDALLALINQATIGVKGIVKDSLTGHPITGAVVEIANRQHSTKTTKDGEFWRLLLPGDYVINVRANGYKPWSRSVHVPSTVLETSEDAVNASSTFADLDRGATVIHASLEPTTVVWSRGAYASSRSSHDIAASSLFPLLFALSLTRTFLHW